MKIHRDVSLLLALSIGASGFALAQGDGEQQSPGRDHRQTQRSPQAQHMQQPRSDQRPQLDSRRNGYANNQERGDERGAGPDHQWHRGDRLPAEYRNRNYVVDDWRAHNLSAPPRGYHWVQNGSDYVLVTIATGIIAQLLLGDR